MKDHTDSERGKPCRHIDFSFRLAAYHSLTSYKTPAGTRNSSMGPPSRIDPATHRTISGRTTTELQISLKELGYTSSLLENNTII